MSLLASVLGLFLIFSSCKKEETEVIEKKEITSSGTKTTNSNNKSLITPPEVIRGRLVFRTIADYEAVANEQSEELQKQFLNEINSRTDFNSLEDSKDKDIATYNELDSKFLSAILNPDLIVQIDTLIFKLDLKKEYVYVLDAHLESEYYALLLEKNPPQGEIVRFNFEDEVLDAIQAGHIKRCCRGGSGGNGGGIGNGGSGGGGGPFGCGENKAPHKIEEDYIDGIETIVTQSGTVTNYLKYSYEVRYRTLGIYCSLFAKIKCDRYRLDPVTGICLHPCLVNYKTDLSLKITRSYKIKCGTEQPMWTGNFQTSYDDKLEYQSWQGSSALTKYYMQAEFSKPSRQSSFDTRTIKYPL